MLFNSFEFAIFLPMVFLVYWFCLNKNLSLQNIFLVIVSYIFYGWWDWRFLFLIALTSGASYISGILIDDYKKKEDTSGSKRKISKWISTSNIVLNLLILCLFKYFNFFSENFNNLFHAFGYEMDWVTLDILLPVGISFYTFQALSYTIDIYKGKMEPTRDVVSFFAYVSFFPQLVAGPIERATNLLPQFYNFRKFDYTKAVDGTRQIFWGLFKKILIADNCAIVANNVFENYHDASGATLFIGALMFTFQIYGDFSGYSDIAIGTARLFGFDLMRNFHFPYFSRDIAEFWRRWHISLTTWFRDYIYIPLGGSRGSKWMSFRNTMIIFLVSGFWHGANWTFIVWGAYHALLFAPLLLLNRNRKYKDSIVAGNRKLPNGKEVIQILTTFLLVLVGWIIFRAETITDAFYYMKGLFSTSLFSVPVIVSRVAFESSYIGIIILLVFEWIQRKKEFGLDLSHSKSGKGIQIVIYLLLALLTFYNGASGQSFIYFQF